MLRLSKYLRPYFPMFLLSVLLLFVQANADLALPDYLSKIVNYGIQQGGISNAVPVAIRASEMNRVTIFLSAENKTAVLNNYILVDNRSADFDRYVKEYPTLAKEPIYVLKNIDATEIDKLNPVMAKALLVVSTIEQAIADPSKAAAMGSAAAGFDLSKLPPGTDPFTLLARLPAAQITQMTDAINTRFGAMGETMVTQAAVSAVKNEYKALGMDTAKLQNDYILSVGAWMLALTVLSVACTIVVGLLAARVAAGSSRDIRRAIFERVERFSHSEFDKFSTASLITRSTNDITQLQMVTMMVVRMVFYAPIVGVGGIIRAMGKDSSMWWIIAVSVVSLIGIMLTVFAVALPKFQIIQKLIDRLNLVARESLTGMMVIRAFNMQEFEEKRFDKANLDLTAVSLFIHRLMVIMMPLMMLIMNILSVVIIWIGAHQVAEANMQVGDMMAFMQYAFQIFFSFMMLSFMFLVLPRAAVSADRIADVLETEPMIHDPQTPQKFPAPFKGEIEFRDVSFRYPHAEEDVLHNISFTAKPGQTTAFIGATGAGKSTVVNLIPRFYDVTTGAILVDGVDIRQVTQHALRDKIGYVPQKSVLFSGTIQSNLQYADKNADADRLQKSAEIAQASEFIHAKPEGMETEISQGGANVSGGQKQRLSIARALVKKPPIFIFDDSFSALDFKTDSALRKSLKENLGDSTLLIVTQRVSTIKNAEQIIVLDDGQIVGKGSHKELMASCETYREIALSQLSKEELA